MRKPSSQHDFSLKVVNVLKSAPEKSNEYSNESIHSITKSTMAIDPIDTARVKGHVCCGANIGHLRLLLHVSKSNTMSVPSASIADNSGV
mmetsp:Transcript_18422/g.20985  ORF Transcript_18422/g.20985 Transcript_18422/m.20985 type:complete len:90 (+) Transcript_18422:1286-1555(+)